MKKLFKGLTRYEKVSFVINGLTINGLVPTYASTKFVFSIVDFRLHGIFLRNMDTTWYKWDFSFGFVVNLLW